MIPMRLKGFVFKVLRYFGLAINKYPSIPDTIRRRKLFFEKMSFDLVIDVGANMGQYVEYLRSQLNYKNQIFSFEPSSSAFRVLKEKASYDSNWKTYNFALGETVTKQEINIAENSNGSSFLDLLPAQSNSACQTKFICKEMVGVFTLDSIADSLNQLKGKIFLKIGTQAFIRPILLGARASLQFIHTIQIDMSIIPSYEGEPVFEEAHSLLNELGFSLIDIECGLANPSTGRLLQLTGFFQRTATPSI